MTKKVRAFMLMWDEVNEGWPIPTSEQSYRAHASLLDAVLPTHGGILVPDTGMWTRHSSINSAFSRYLWTTARDMGQEYSPVCEPYGLGDLVKFKTLLDTPANWSAIGDGLVTLALTAIDGPWSTILYDYPDIEAAYVTKQEQFVTVLSQKARAANIPFAISYRGVSPADEAASPDLDVLRDISDVIDYYMYIYWDTPFSPTPYWWCRSSIENALQHGFEPENIYLGLFLPSYYYNFSPSVNCWITHAQGLQTIADHNANLEWVEDHAVGLIREKYARLSSTAHIWIEDEVTIRDRLCLVTEFDLAGIMLFVLGCEADSVWRAVRKWKYGLPQGIQKAQKIHGSGGLFSRG